MCKCSSITAADHQAVHKWRIVQLQVKIHRCFLVKAFFWVTYQMISRSKSHKCPSPPQHSARSCCYPKMVTFDHWVSLSEFSYCLFLFCSIRQLSWVPSPPPISMEQLLSTNGQLRPLSVTLWVCLFCKPASSSAQFTKWYQLCAPPSTWSSCYASTKLSNFTTSATLWMFLG